MRRLLSLDTTKKIFSADHVIRSKIIGAPWQEKKRSATKVISLPYGLKHLNSYWDCFISYVSCFLYHRTNGLEGQICSTEAFFPIPCTNLFGTCRIRFTHGLYPPAAQQSSLESLKKPDSIRTYGIFPRHITSVGYQFNVKPRDYEQVIG